MMNHDRSHIDAVANHVYTTPVVREVAIGAGRPSSPFPRAPQPPAGPRADERGGDA